MASVPQIFVAKRDFLLDFYSMQKQCTKKTAQNFVKYNTVLMAQQRNTPANWIVYFQRIYELKLSKSFNL